MLGRQALSPIPLVFRIEPRLCTDCGADPLVRGRPPGRPVVLAKHGVVLFRPGSLGRRSVLEFIGDCLPALPDLTLEGKITGHGPRNPLSIAPLVPPGRSPIMLSKNVPRSGV